MMEDSSSSFPKNSLTFKFKRTSLLEEALEIPKTTTLLFAAKKYLHFTPALCSLDLAKNPPKKASKAK